MSNSSSVQLWPYVCRELQGVCRFRWGTSPTVCSFCFLSHLWCLAASFVSLASFMQQICRPSVIIKYCPRGGQIFLGEVQYSCLGDAYFFDYTVSTQLNFLWNTLHGGHHFFLLISTECQLIGSLSAQNWMVEAVNEVPANITNACSANLSNYNTNYALTNKLPHFNIIVTFVIQSVARLFLLHENKQCWQRQKPIFFPQSSTAQ